MDRLRFLLNRPLDPLAVRAVVILTTAILLGFTAVFVLDTRESGPAVAPSAQGLSAQPQSGQPFGRAPVHAPPPLQAPSSRRRQDPQDDKGSPAGRRATRALQSHRALQHVPYHRGVLSIALTGVRGGRAVLRVSAPTAADARRGWLRFLRRYGDMGRAYAPRFDVSGSSGEPGSGG